jgi:lysozyme family protein
MNDSALNEIIKDIIDSKMIFCTEHTLIMYFKQALIKSINAVKKKNENEQKSSEDVDSSNNNSSKDDFLNVENKRHFLRVLSMILNCLNQSLKRKRSIH